MKHSRQAVGQGPKQDCMAKKEEHLILMKGNHVYAIPLLYVEPVLSIIRQYYKTNYFIKILYFACSYTKTNCFVLY